MRLRVAGQRLLGKPRYHPMSFSAFDLHPSLERALDAMGFSQPTPIQRDAIPPGLDGRDLLACAMTGSGKTAAFLIPIIEMLLDSKRGTTRALVLTPTRELAAQIVEHFEALARFTPLKAAAVYGGVGMRPQEQAFRRGVDLIVACPGRLLDHFQYDYAKLRGLEVLVLDEADRMLDMGFLPDIKRVLRHLPETDQTLLFSATMPAQIVELSGRLLHQPVHINVERKAAPATRITQAVYRVQQQHKAPLMLALLQSEVIDNVLVFTRTKHRADRLCRFLGKKGVASERIHGNRSQGQRTRALAAFKQGEIRVLVATDIAARGIDVTALSHVVNFDIPNLPEDYIHRVGRTARAAASGEALTFVTPEESRDLRSIERAINQRLPVRRLEGFDPDNAADEQLEIPLAERIAAIRARRAEERARSRAKAAGKGNSKSAKPRGSRKGNARPDGARAQDGRPERGRSGNSRANGGRPNAQANGNTKANGNVNGNRQSQGAQGANSSPKSGPRNGQSKAKGPEAGAREQQGGGWKPRRRRRPKRGRGMAAAR